MMIRTVSLLSMLAVAGMAHAQVHVYAEQNVNQNVGKVEQLGTAVFGTQYTTPTVSFVNGKAVMRDDHRQHHRSIGSRKQRRSDGGGLLRLR